jgi:hypothetical protein
MPTAMLLWLLVKTSQLPGWINFRALMINRGEGAAPISATDTVCVIVRVCLGPFLLEYANRAKTS